MDESSEMLGVYDVKNRGQLQLAVHGEPLEAGHLLLPKHARGMVGGQVADQVRDARAQLQREVRRRGAHQRAHVVDCDLASLAQPVGVLSLAHPEPVAPVCGTTSSRASICACTPTEIALGSPITQPWL